MIVYVFAIFKFRFEVNINFSITLPENLLFSLKTSSATLQTLMTSLEGLTSPPLSFRRKNAELDSSSSNTAQQI
jgi:hypothetical protein